MYKLNQDQKKVLPVLRTWWRSNKLFHVINAPAGTGKSFLVEYFIKDINVTPLLLTPTWEALKQIKDKTPSIDKEHFRTIHSALGLRPTDHEEELKFEQVALPALWENYNLAIVDESSMLGIELIEILQSIGVKILFIGHESQLPPVVRNLDMFDKCVSPIFSMGYDTSTLTIPMRNTGKLWEFNQQREEDIYNSNRIIPTDFDISRPELTNYLKSKEGIDGFINNETKIVVYTNDGVDRYNTTVRVNCFGSLANINKYLNTDRIILTSPLTAIQELERYHDTGLKRVMNSKSLETFYANTKAEVISCKEVLVTLNKHLAVPCYKIKVDIEGENYYLYECIDAKDYAKISAYYTHQAWGKSKPNDKAKAFREKYFILSCFAQIKHFYAATAHRLQGSSVPNVIVCLADINKANNIILRKKLTYVACSRVINNLMIYRGFM